MCCSSVQKNSDTVHTRHIFFFHAAVDNHCCPHIVRTATRYTLKVAANLTQILNFKANFHKEFEPFSTKKLC